MQQYRVLKENETGTGILVEHDAGTTHTEKKGDELLKEIHDKANQNEPIIVYSTLQKANTPNRNGRVYPKNILEREVKKYQDIINKNASFHQMDHPESSIVELKSGSPHRVLELWWDGDYLMGKLEILVSKGFREHGGIYCDGDMMAHYISYGMTMGISSRGVGSLKQENGKKMVQDDFELICWDIVSSPSTPGSYVFSDLDMRDAYDEKSTNDSDFDQRQINQGSSDLQNTLEKFLNLTNR